MSAPATTRESAAVNAVARETLRRIAQERLSPTPETYARIYQDIARTHPDHPPQAAVDGGVQAKALSTTITRLVAQVDAHHAGITVTRKREGLKRALIPRVEPVDALRARLERLVDSWNGPNAATGAQVDVFLGTDIMGAQSDEADGLPTAPYAATHVTPTMQGIHGATATHPVSSSSARAMPLRTANSAELSDRVVSVRLAGLLALVLKNIEELTPESGLLGNQIEQIGRVLTVPLTESKLDEAERCLRALIVRQGAIKQGLAETKRAMRDLASTLLDRLSTLVTSTDHYSTKAVEMAQRIADAEDLAQLSDLTQMLVADTRLMSANVAAERAMLEEARSRAQQLQERTVALETKLREASALVRTDPLTRAMNRRGFGDAFTTEMRRADGLLPLVVLLDVDNFKSINEAHGHAIGDQVLCRLVEILHRCAQPEDTVARYGGEEFALILPRGRVDEAEATVTRMQRALRDDNGIGGGVHPPVTFSAGIAQVDRGESLAAVMTRADVALRRAKHAGKNCIVVAPVATHSP